MFDVQVPISLSRAAVFHVSIDPAANAGLRADFLYIRGRSGVTTESLTPEVLPDVASCAVLSAHSVLLGAGCIASAAMPEA